MTASPDPLALVDLEIHLLLEAVYRVTGHDFREYTPPTLRRRIAERVRAEQVRSISGLQEKALHDPICMQRLIQGLTGVRGAFFRDPAFFRAFRTRIVPTLRTYPFFRIWQPGCSTGEDAYALAMVLREEGIVHRSKIYATDVSDRAIAHAKHAAYAIGTVEDAETAYVEAGGCGSIYDHVARAGEVMLCDTALKEHIVFARHNLATDASFNDFHVVVARNVLGDFTKALQLRVHNLLLASLVRSGFLALGANDSIRYTPHERCYQEVDSVQHIYRRVR